MVLLCNLRFFREFFYSIERAAQCACVASPQRRPLTSVASTTKLELPGVVALDQSSVGCGKDCVTTSVFHCAVFYAPVDDSRTWRD